MSKGSRDCAAVNQSCGFSTSAQVPRSSTSCNALSHARRTGRASRCEHALSLLCVDHTGTRTHRGRTGQGLHGLVAAVLYAERTVLVELNPRAARFARFNLALNAVSADAAVVALGDLFGAVSALREPWASMRFDLIVSNPPYQPHDFGINLAAGLFISCVHCRALSAVTLHSQSRVCCHTSTTSFHLQTAATAAKRYQPRSSMARGTGWPTAGACCRLYISSTARTMPRGRCTAGGPSHLAARHRM